MFISLPLVKFPELSISMTLSLPSSAQWYLRVMWTASLVHPKFSIIAVREFLFFNKVLEKESQP